MMKIKHRIDRFMGALGFYLLNNLVMEFPSYRIRKAFAVRVCHARIGRNTSIHMHCFITGTNLRIGSNTVINRFTYLDGRGGLTIGDNVNISHYTIIQSLDHDLQSPRFEGRARPVVIGDHVWIGARALILPGVRLEEGAVVAAGSVVTRDVPAYTVVAGSPARPIKTRNRKIEYKSRYFPLFDTDIQ